jgi:two-component system, chemotaxis family, chemotaxis protein CheY
MKNMLRIVIADDSSMARAFARKCLEIAGYRDAEFVEAKNGDEAVNLLREKRADLLVTDLNMPVLDGLQVVRRVSASPKLNGMPVIVITSAANPAMKQQLLDAGATCVLSKPVSPADIAEAVKNAISVGEQS